MNKPTVGQKVVLKSSGNNARYGIKIEEWEVKKVGRKFFEVWRDNLEYTTIKFHLENNRQVHSITPDWTLYFSEQELLDEKEKNEIEGQLRKILGTYGSTNLTLSQLKQIKEIIDNQ